MKKSVSKGIVLMASCFALGCSSDAFQEDMIAAQSTISLVSPEGVRIASSVSELASLPYTENGQVVDAPVTITKIEYSSVAKAAPFIKSTRFNDGSAIQALVYFKTANGNKGQWVIEMPVS